MTRRDMIIVAVLANMGVLAILFMLAFRADEEEVKDNSQIAYTLTEEAIRQPQPVQEIVTKLNPPEEIDAALDEEEAALPVVHATDDENFQLVEPETPSVVVKNEQSRPLEASATAALVEVTIKRGDALEKIARANGTTVEAIMKANNLKSDRLRIGQVLKIPIGAGKKVAQVAKAEPSKALISQGSAEYYTIKNGDNPWKIAKQHKIKLEELLKLNNLDEEKARNLKIGDTIRVR